MDEVIPKISLDGKLLNPVTEPALHAEVNDKLELFCATTQSLAIFKFTVHLLVIFFFFK